jgi:RNA polymerase sigma-70 factor (ECF subfamily)
MERLADTSDDRRGVEDEVIDSTFDAAVEAAYDRLPEKFRQVVEMVDLGGLSYQESADILGIPVGTIMSRLHRARGRMRSDIEAAGITDAHGRRPDDP